MMRFIYLFTFCCGFLIGCNINYPADSNATLQGRITKKQVMRYLPGVHLGQAQLLENSALDKESFRIKNGLITHGRFLVLEELNPSTIHLNNYNSLFVDSTFSNQTFEMYEAGPSALAIRYEAFLGRTVRVNPTDRVQVTCKISKLVVVTDNHKPYLAAILDKPVQTSFNHAWATTNKRLNPYPFTEIKDEVLSQSALIHFDSLTECERVMKEQVDHYDEYDYEETTVRIFEFRKSEKYVVVQRNHRRTCDVITANYTALYHVTPGNWTREAEGSINLLFKDLIDVDGDLYPELLMINEFETAIYEITYKGFDEMESVTWSLSGFDVPC